MTNPTLPELPPKEHAMRWANSDGPLTTAMDNVLAWRMGEACNSASAASAGDLIDRGLALLNELRAKGFDVTYREEPIRPTSRGE